METIRSSPKTESSVFRLAWSGEAKMKEEQIATLTEGQSRMIAHETSMEELLKHLQPSSAGQSEKPKWLMFMESAGAVALITVLIGGMLGGIITAIFQEYQKDREFQQAWLKARGDIALATSKEYHDKEVEVANQAFDLVGRCITVSDDLIYLTSPVFDPGKYEDVRSVKNQRLTVLKAYNRCANDWRESREKLQLLMSYYHHGQTEVSQSWQNAQQSVTRYMECAHDWYLQHSDAPSSTDGTCKAERDNYAAAMHRLNETFDVTRRYLWQGWESPERLREALRKGD